MRWLKSISSSTISHHISQSIIFQPISISLIFCLISHLPSNIIYHLIISSHLPSIRSIWWNSTRHLVPLLDMINCGEEMIFDEMVVDDNIDQQNQQSSQQSSQPNNNEDNNMIKMEKENHQPSSKNNQNDDQQINENDQNQNIMRVHQTIQSKFTSHIITNSSLFYPTFDIELIENYGQISSIYYQYHGFFISNSSFDCIDIPVFIISSISSIKNENQSKKEEVMKSKSNLVLNMFKQVR